jgi:hypothetical protein
MEFTAAVAGRNGRNPRLEFIRFMATAFEEGAPGIRRLEFIFSMAGRRGRTC